MLNGESVSALHHELQIKRSVLYRWRDATARREWRACNGPRPAAGSAESAAAGRRPGAAAARRIAELERKIGQQALDLDFLRRAFKRVKELRRKPTEPGATASTEKSGA
jgi:transposase